MAMFPDDPETGDAEYPGDLKAVRRDSQRTRRRRNENNGGIRRPRNRELEHQRFLERAQRRDLYPHVATKIVRVAFDLKKLQLKKGFDTHDQLVDFLANEKVVRKARSENAVATFAERKIISAAIVFCELEGYMAIVFDNGKRYMETLIDDPCHANCGCRISSHRQLQAA